jgi:predicted transposase YdaD
MQQRLRLRGARPQAASLWAATYILMGIRYSGELAARLLREVITMKESVTYQAILEEGKAEGMAKGRVVEAKKLLRLQGESAFGSPDARTAARLERIDDLERLEALGVRLLKVRSWHELLELPAPRRGRRPPAPGGS